MGGGGAKKKESEQSKNRRFVNEGRGKVAGGRGMVTDDQILFFVLNVEKPYLRHTIKFMCIAFFSVKIIIQKVCYFTPIPNYA